VCLWCRVRRLGEVVATLAREVGEMEGGDASRTAYVSLASSNRTGEVSPPESPAHPLCSTPRNRRSADQMMMEEAERFLGESNV
jgi:hypothetical protein